MFLHQPLRQLQVSRPAGLPKRRSRLQKRESHGGLHGDKLLCPYDPWRERERVVSVRVVYVSGVHAHTGVCSGAVCAHV